MSETAWFETALMRPDEWQGCWLGMPCGGPAQLIRREFTLEKEIASARVYIAGLGYYELYLNEMCIRDRAQPEPSPGGEQPFGELVLPNIEIPDSFETRS